MASADPASPFPEPKDGATGEVAPAEDSEERLNELQEEVARLKAQNDELAATGKGAKPPHRLARASRRVFAAALVPLVAILVVLSVTIVWVHATVINTDGFVSTVGPIAKDPAVTAAVGRELTDELFTKLDVEARVKALLPPRAEPIAGPITSAAHGAVQGQLTNALRRPRFQHLWNSALTFVHAQTIAALRGQGNAVKVNGDTVTLNMVPLVNAGLSGLSSSTAHLLGRNVSIPKVTAGELPATVRDKLSSALGVQLPPSFANITLFRSKSVKVASNAVSLIDVLYWLLPLLTAVLAALSIWLSMRRRRTMMQLAGFSLVAIVLFRRLTFRFQSELISTAKPENRSAASAIIHQLTGGLLNDMLIALIIMLVVLAIGAITGPYAWAVWIRHGVAQAGRATGRFAADTYRSVKERGWAGRPANLFVRDHRALLQWGGAAVAVVLMWILPWSGALIVLALLAVYEIACRQLATGAS